MFKLSALVAAATLALSSTAFAGSTPAERLDRVLSVLGQRGVENARVVKSGDETIVRGTRNGRAVEVRVRRAPTVEKGIRLKKHTRRPDAEDSRPARRVEQPKTPVAVQTPAQTPAQNPAPEQVKQIDRLADEGGMPTAPASQPATQPATNPSGIKATAGDDGLRDLPKRDIGAIYDTKDASVKAKRPSFSLGALDMAKGPRSSPAILPAK